MMAIPALAQAPVTNGGYQSLNDWSDQQFITPLEAPNLPQEAFEYTIVSDAYLIPHHVYQLPPITQQIPKPEHRQSGGLPPREFIEYLQSVATPEEVQILTKIAYCESHWTQKWNSKHDLNPNYYTAYGFFQILSSTALATDPTLDRLDPLDNILLAVKLYRKRGTSPWALSSGCWATK